MRRLVLHGAESDQGRALILISALHHAAEALARWTIRVIDTHDFAVPVAVTALRWDTGLDIAVVPEGGRVEALEGARLFAAVANNDIAHLPVALASGLGVTTMVAVQFPEPSKHGAAIFALQRAAHDPALLAEALMRRLVVV